MCVRAHTHTHSLSLTLSGPLAVAGRAIAADCPVPLIEVYINAFLFLVSFAAVSVLTPHQPIPLTLSSRTPEPLSFLPLLPLLVCVCANCKSLCTSGMCLSKRSSHQPTLPKLPPPQPHSPPPGLCLISMCLCFLQPIAAAVRLALLRATRSRM